MADCVISEEMRNRIREMAAEPDPMSQAAISRETGVARTTVRDNLEPKRPRTARFLLPQPALLDIAVEWTLRSGDMPNSVTMNKTKASLIDGSAWRLCIEGRVNARGDWEHWPQAHDFTRSFRSWDLAHLAIGKEIERRRVEGDPYVPTPIPADKRREAALCGHTWDVLNQRPASGDAARSIELRYLMSADGYVRIPSAPDRGGLLIIGDAGTGRTTLLAQAVAVDLLEPSLTVVELTRVGKPRLADGLQQSHLIDLRDLIFAGVHAYIQSDDRDVRACVIAVAAQAALDSGRHVSLVVDDADDVIEELTQLSRIKDASSTHISAAWAPRSDKYQLGLWLTHSTRCMFRISDPATAELFCRALNLILRNGVLTEYAPRDGRLTTTWARTSGHGPTARHRET
ncbi:MAG: hypothetical protein QOG15_1985 [Solirubrobacteraceae bacterium]|jgi:hypothetical protein|nr:hypothetical protein [Solirubrobacteraceae bacterium]